MTSPIQALFDAPHIVLTKWSVYETPIRGEDEPWTRHIVGYSKEHGAGQASAAIVAFDPLRRVALTKSGRLYRLDGPPGHSLAGNLVWQRWKLLSGVAKEKDVTDEFVGLTVPLPLPVAA